MKVSFMRGRERVKFTAHPKRKGKIPARLKKFQFKAGAKRTKACLKKARAKLKTMGWKFR